MLQAFAFYMFATILVICAASVISARNPVHSVLFLIACFFNAAGLFVLLGAEFIALIMVIVYVGAVAVLFLFVVMMLDISFAELRKGAMQYVPLGLLIGGVLLAELFMLYSAWPQKVSAFGAVAEAEGLTNTQALGAVIYTDYIYVFQVSGLILLVAMIGAIVLTLRPNPDVKPQVIADQNARTRAGAIEIKKVPSRTGV